MMEVPLIKGTIFRGIWWKCPKLTPFRGTLGSAPTKLPLYLYRVLVCAAPTQNPSYLCLKKETAMILQDVKIP
jgi:hypothetical protein